MTRDEALNRKNWMNSIGFMTSFSEQKIIDSINKIYDDFESKNCNNCRYYFTEDGLSYIIEECEEDVTDFTSVKAETFYCNKWKK